MCCCYLRHAACAAVVCAALDGHLADDLKEVFTTGWSTNQCKPEQVEYGPEHGPEYKSENKPEHKPAYELTYETTDEWRPSCEAVDELTDEPA